MSSAEGVVVDSSVWSLALRRNFDASSETNLLRELITRQQAKIFGAIRQEVLSGICSPEQFARLRRYLQAFPDLSLHETDYETAADFFNRCRRQGIQGSNVDFLICAVAYGRNFAILTTDNDFKNFQRLLPIELVRSPS